MSKAALYQGLSQGLAAFGQGLQQQQIESARRRREESLMALRRQWQQQDKVENQEFQLSLMDREDERWNERFEREREAARADRDYVSPTDQSLIDYRSAIVERARADDDRNSDPFSLAKINLSSFTPTSVAAAKRFIEQGGDEAGALELLEYKSNIDQEAQLEQNIHAQALQTTNELLFGDVPPEEVYKQYGIPPDASPKEAREKIFWEEYQFLKRTRTGDPMASEKGQSGDREPTTPEADVDETGQGLAFRTGGMVRGLMDEVSGSPVKTALWGPLPRLYQGLLHEALDGPVQSFRQGYRAQGGGGLDENLLRDVAADLQTMSEEQVREELRRSGEPNPDRVIEAAKAMMQQ